MEPSGGQGSSASERRCSMRSLDGASSAIMRRARPLGIVPADEGESGHQLAFAYQGLDCVG